jgi:hypothetical protein
MNNHTPQVRTAKGTVKLVLSCGSLGKDAVWRRRALTGASNYLRFAVEILAHRRPGDGKPIGLGPPVLVGDELAETAVVRHLQAFDEAVADDGDARDAVRAGGGIIADAGVPA